MFSRIIRITSIRDDTFDTRKHKLTIKANVNDKEKITQRRYKLMKQGLLCIPATNKTRLKHITEQ